MLDRISLPTVLFVAALLATLAACSRGPEKEPEPAESLVVVQAVEPLALPPAPEQPLPDEGLSEFPRDDGNEDAANQPSHGWGGNLPRDRSVQESPHPNGDRTGSSTGLGGGISGGAGSGGRGGVEFRRARGGGGAARRKPDTRGGETSNPVFVPPQTTSASPTQGALMAQRGGEVVGEFPLKQTRVNAKVSGTVASTTMTQTFTNPYAEAIEAVYRFPLPRDAAINDFVMDCNGRRIRGMVRPREEALRIYQDARSRGQTASLLTQERANVFTQRVANIAVKEQVEVTITFFQTLAYRDGRFEYVFPMVVGPRYGSPVPQASPAATPAAPGQPVPQSERRPDTGDDAGGVNAPILPLATRSGHDIRISIDIDAGLPLDMGRLQSVAHTVTIAATNTNRALVTLDPRENIPNRDFVLRWQLAGQAPAVGLVTQRDGEGGYFSLQIQPQTDARDADVTPREITFILDVSGSMSGAPSQMSKDVIRRTLDRLRPDDAFNIVLFANGNEQLFDLPAANTRENVDKARAFLGNAEASGGTEMLAGLQRALGASHDALRLQMYAFLTDGFVGEEDPIFATIKQHGQAARFFAFGIGSSVNRTLIDGIAEFGNGRAIYCLPRDDQYAPNAVDAFFGAIDSPVLCDIDLDWGTLPVSDVMPRVPRDLFAAQPIVLHAQFGAPAQGTLLVRGRVGVRRVTYEVPVNFGNAEKTNPALGTIWARQRIQQLDADRLGDGDPRVAIDEITRLALRFNLASEFTSFVAVDESRVVGNGNPLRIFQPVEMPEDLVLAGDAKPKAGSRSVRVPGWGLVAGETADGSVLVLKVENGSAAAEAGMKAGQVLRKVGGIAVRNLDRLETTLQQAKANAKIAIETELTDAGQTHQAKFELPDPAAK